ncbi:5-formyltetrahydrofolate cyclo-ligase [Brevibacterium atlanticum]|uniref:5-formyltetrahydrofolate cyclo-ligase n=1 Tax=Brevibacterium atlanticum TaxID=2697563 RepID=UPI001D1809BE|nr:5-formyltetrahydrofolate cyclo-ligase [Brevibacterium atlanticum]
MDSSTSKAQLRSHIRSARADRARAEVGAGSIATVAGGLAGDSPTEVGPDSVTTVADAAWELISSRPVRSLLAYAALPGEPDLDPAIDRFLAAGGTVFLPVVTKVGEPLAFGEVTGSMATLEPQGKWGIREPQCDTGFLTAEELLSSGVGLDLIFVPALGFGVDGARLGNGGGFYDRTFGPHGAAPLGQEPRVVGVCFASELALTGLVAEDWDLRIPAAATETGLHTFEPA